MIVLLLISLNSYAQTNEHVDFPTGDLEKSDTIEVSVPIYFIKLANAKMIERNYLFQIVNEQDSIINLKDEYISEQHNIIINFQEKVNDVNQLNAAINKELEKQKTKTKILGYGAGVVTIGLIVGLLIK